MSELTYQDFSRKFGYSLLPAVLFFVVSLPEVYNTTDKLGSRLGKSVDRLGFSTADDSCPTSTGKFIHSLVFFLLVWALMKFTRSADTSSHKSNGLLAKYAFYSTLLFFLVSSTDAYNVTSRLVDGLTNTPGCPTMKGAFVHGLVFLVAVTLVMYFPKDQ